MLRIILLALLFAASFASAQDIPESREHVALQRYVELLERQPKFGTTFDRVYRHHLERGSVEAFVKTYRDRLDKDAADGAAAMLVGLIELQRGREPAAVAVLKIADKHRATDPLASFYLGRALASTNDFDAAIAAFQRAIERQPAKVELLEITQTLAQTQQRADRKDDAAASWRQLEQLFPADVRVQERIANASVEVGNLDDAVRRFEGLAKLANDPQARVRYSLKVAELNLNRGEQDAALEGLERLLDGLKPDSWAYRTVRQKIEDIFASQDDLVGLEAYYRAGLKRRGDDLDAQLRLGRVLVQSRQHDAAIVLFRATIKQAPSHLPTRKALIDVLVLARRFSDAAAEHAAIDKLVPNDPDNVRAWGHAVLRDSQMAEDSRRQLAADIWRRLLLAKPNDPLLQTQVAELLGSAELPQEALKLYERAVVLAPNEPQYRESLAAHLQRLGRKDDAIAALRLMASGERRTAENLARLAQLLRNNGFVDESLAAQREAGELDPSVPTLLTSVRWLRQERQTDAAFEQLDRARKLAQSNDEQQLVLIEELALLRESDRLGAEIAKLKTQHAMAAPGASELRRLAQLSLAAERFEDAHVAIREALRLDDVDLRSWSLAAQVSESRRQWDDAAKALRVLADRDTRFRARHLQRLIKIEQRQGRMESALAAAQQLVAAARGNAEHLQTLADLHFAMGKSRLGLDVLRTAAQANATSADVWSRLAAKQHQHGSREEAIETLWHAFEVSTVATERRDIARRLADQTKDTPHFARLVSRLKQLEQDPAREMDIKLCLAEMWHAVGDESQAAAVLKRVHDNEPRNVEVLARLVAQALAENDAALAVSYQRRLVEVAPSHDAEAELARLLFASGDVAAAEQLTSKLLTSARLERHQVIEVMDQLISQGQLATATKLINRHLEGSPNDWEALFRSAVSAWLSGENELSQARIMRLRALDLARDEPSSKARHERSRADAGDFRGVGFQPAEQPQTRQAGSGPKVAAPKSLSSLTSSEVAVENIQQLQQLAHEAGRRKSLRVPLRSPRDFGEACAAALYLQLSLTDWEKAGVIERAEFEELIQPKSERPDRLWSWLVVLRHGPFGSDDGADDDKRKPLDESRLRDVARRLAREPGPDGKLQFLKWFSAKSVGGVDGNSFEVSLSADALIELLECVDEVRSEHADQLSLPADIAPLLIALRQAERFDDVERLAVSVVPWVQSTNDLVALISAAGSTRTERVVTNHMRLRYLPEGADSDRVPQLATSEWDALIKVVGYSGNLAEQRELQALFLKSQAANSQPIVYRNRLLRVEPVVPLVQEGRGGVFAVAQGFGGHVGCGGAGIADDRGDGALPSSFFNKEALELLEAVCRSHTTSDLKRGDKQPREATALIDSLAELIESESPSVRIVGSLAQAFAFSFLDQKPQAMERLRLLLRSVPDSFDVRYEVAALQARSMNAKSRKTIPADVAAAIATLDGIELDDPKLLLHRERYSLELAFEADNQNRARRAVKRLCEMPLTLEQQLGVLAAMIALDMPQEQLAWLAELRKLATWMPELRLELAAGYLLAGQTEVAIELALTGLNQFDLATEAERDAFKLYVSVGEATLTTTPNDWSLSKVMSPEQVKSFSNKLIVEAPLNQRGALLAEFLTRCARPSFERTEHRRRLLEVWAKLEQVDPVELVEQADEEIRKRGASADAAKVSDLYYRALRLRPALLYERQEKVWFLFVRANRIDDFVDLLLRMDHSDGSQSPWLAIKLARERLTGNKTQTKQGLALLRATRQKLPTYQRLALEQLSDDDVLAYPSFFNDGDLSLIPLYPRQPLTGWQHAFSDLNAEHEGNIQGPVQALGGALSMPVMREALRGAINETLQAHPKWLTGQLVLALIELRSSEFAPAEARLLKLVRSDEMTMQSQALLASELTRIPTANVVSVRVLEALCSREDSDDGWDISESADRSLLMLYGNRGELHQVRRVAARLLKRRTQLLADEKDGDDLQTQLLRVRQEHVEMLASYSPAAALSALRDLHAAAIAIQDDRPRIWDLMQSKLSHRVFDIAGCSLKDSGEFMAGFVQLADAGTPESVARVNLLLDVTSNGSDYAPVSSFLDVCVKAAVKKPDASRVELLKQRLADASKQRIDLSVPIAQTLLTLSATSDEATVIAALKSLLAATEKHPLPESIETPEAKRQTEQHIGLWTVARHAKRSPSSEVRTLGQELATKALAAAKRHPRSAWRESLETEQRRGP